MPSPKRRDLRRLSIPLLLPLSIAGCVTTPLSPPILDALNCARLIPPSYRSPVPSAGLLGPTETVGALAVRYDAQTAALDRANGRTDDLVQLADLCQAQQQAVLKALNPPAPWWRFWRGKTP